MAAREGERRRDLREFLKDAFSPDDFEIVVRESHLADIASDVNAKAAGKRYFFDVIQALEQRGRIDGGFFGLLTQERPEKAELIASLAESWDVAEKSPAKPTGANDAPVGSAANAEAYYTAYRVALEQRSWDDALAAFQQAVDADPRFAAWPANKYRVERILGAGAIGVAFLCYHHYKGRRVVIKTFEAAGIDRDINTLFREAQILDRLDHPGIVRLLDCGFADQDRQQRPYLEIAHFADSLALDDHVHQHGTLTPDDLVPVAVQTAEALRAAHEAGVFHRDVKPANLLVRKTARGWEVKVIDFGLSLRRGLVQASQARAAGLNRSMIGSAVEGTLHYAAPEQLDPDRSREVDPHSDVFGFGRTCYFALFGEPYPDLADLDTLPPLWKDFLGQCTAKRIDRRPKDFASVLERLAAFQERQAAVDEAPLPDPPAIATVDASPVAKAALATVKTTPGTVPAPRFTNTLRMTMVRIEPGEFLMGSTKAQIDKLVKQFPDTNRDLYDDEQPQHRVEITWPFYLAAHQVTVGQFRWFVEGSGYKTEAERDGKGGWGWNAAAGKYEQDPKYTWQNPGFPQTNEHPVVNVSWNDAMAFLGWLNEQDKEKQRGYRLPTEAEWEYACRAGTGGLYGGDDDSESLVRIANVADASYKKVNPSATCIRGNDGFVYTAPVGSFEPNAWHLYDMIGNVWEWCDDWYDPKFYQSSPRENPHNTAMASSRVFRGGSWNYTPGYGRPAARRRIAPEARRRQPRVPRGRSPGIGPSTQSWQASALKRRPVGVEAEPTPVPSRCGKARR